jgi:hypothetical protein
MNITTAQTPAERITPGVGRQIINAYNPDGTFLRQVRHYGTEAQARAYIALQAGHDTDPERSTLVATLRGQESGMVTAEVTPAETITEVTTETVTEVTTGATADERIRAAYSAVTGGTPGTWIDLSRIRPHLQDITRAEQDAALRQLERQPDVNLVPESNQKTLTPARRAAAVEIGFQPKHLLWIGA